MPKKIPDVIHEPNNIRPSNHKPLGYNHGPKAFGPEIVSENNPKNLHKGMIVLGLDKKDGRWKMGAFQGTIVTDGHTKYILQLSKGWDFATLMTDRVNGSVSFSG